MTYLGIDPGTEKTAISKISLHYATPNTLSLVEAFILPNEACRSWLRDELDWVWIDAVGIERMESFGRAGASIFETCIWIGKFLSVMEQDTIYSLARKTITSNICGSTGSDSTVRQALIDRFGKPGTKKNPGPTYGITKDMWSSTAVAVTLADYLDGRFKSKAIRQWTP